MAFWNEIILRKTWIYREHFFKKLEIFGAKKRNNFEPHIYVCLCAQQLNLSFLFSFFAKFSAAANSDWLRAATLFLPFLIRSNDDAFFSFLFFFFLSFFLSFPSSFLSLFSRVVAVCGVGISRLIWWWSHNEVRERIATLKQRKKKEEEVAAKMPPTFFRPLSFSSKEERELRHFLSSHKTCRASERASAYLL